MPCWYFGRSVLNETPTVKAGVSIDTEAKYRREGAKLIIDAGTALGLRYDVCATGVVYFHRFYILHSFSDFHRYVTGTCCLLLAAKMDESYVTCDAAVKTVQSLLTSTQFTVFGANAKQEILIMEKIVLEALKFDLIVEHPYTHLLKFIKLFKGDQTTIEQLLKMSWTFVNDSLCTTLCLEWEPDLIAISLLYLSCRLLKFTVSDWLDKPVGFSGKWYQFFLKDVTLDIVEAICREVLDLYAGSKSEPKVKRSSSRADRDADKDSLSSLSSNASRHHGRSSDVARRRRTKSRSRSVDKKRRHAHHKSPHKTTTDASPVTSATNATRDMSPISPTPLPSEPKDQLLSREAFEALQKLMRRQSGLPEEMKRSPSPLRNKRAASPPVAAMSYPPPGHPYPMYYPPPHNMGPPFLSPPPHYGPPMGYPNMPPPGHGEHLPPVIIPGHPWMPPPGGSGAGLPPVLMGAPPPHGTGMMTHMAGHFIPGARPGFSEPPPRY